MNRHIAVVGAGVMGMMVSLRLAALGAQITLIEKRSHLGLGASWAAAGILSPLDLWNHKGDVAPYKNAKAMWKNWETKAQKLGFAESFEIDDKVYFSSLDSAKINRLRQMGFQCEIIPSQELAEQLGAYASVHSPNSQQSHAVLLNLGVLRPPIAMAGLSYLVNKNPNITCLTAEISTVSVKPHAVLLDAQGDVVCDCHTCVLTLGAWTSLLNVQENGASLQLPKIVPVKGQMVAWNALSIPNTQSKEALLLQDKQKSSKNSDDEGWALITDDGYAVKRRSNDENSLTLYGSSIEHSGYNATVSHSTKAALVARARKLFPHEPIFQQQPQLHWAGLRPQLVMPFSNPIENSGKLWALAGHYRHGIGLAPSASKAFADLILAFNG